ncbi:MAG TPA: YebC/PmpR family DNA-binding transcriptional regulator [Erysipelotrichaceae bacterium]|nr:YebC/PmpR family DNA-binding transcriptional regulator [Erysipelotrichaceae bacterium]
MGRAFEVRKAAMMKTSAAKTKVYSRFGKEIYIAAKAGVPDPEMNQGLKRMIERAKANQVPADVIKRAIEKAKGGTDESYTSVRYEGFGPGNCTIIVDCLTDNVNRTVSDVRNCFTKTKSKMGVSGSVAHLYDHIGILAFDFGDDEAMLDALIEHDVDVIDLELDGQTMNLTVNPNDLYKAKAAVESLIPEVEFSALETTMSPHEMVNLSGEDVDLFQRFMNMIDELDDVQEVYHNVEM